MVWDARQPVPSLVLNAHPREILTGDWCKYNDCVIATGSIDKSIKVRCSYRMLTVAAFDGVHGCGLSLQHQQATCRAANLTVHSCGTCLMIVDTCLM
jgi:hypothetical protein